MPHLQEVGGAVTKNLFLKDKKKKTLWLVTVRHDRQVREHLCPGSMGPASMCIVVLCVWWFCMDSGSVSWFYLSLFCVLVLCVW